MKHIYSFQFEIIVVDNSSTDGSQEVVKKYFPNIKLIVNGSNLGFAKANNIGIKKSKGEFVCLLNSDVEVLEDCFTQMLDFMRVNSKIGILGPKILNSDKTLQPSCRSLPSLWNSWCRTLALDTFFPRSKLLSGQFMTHWEHSEVKEVDMLSGCFWMVRRLAIEQVGLLDENFFMYGEDMDWCKRFWLADWSIVYYPIVNAMHYGGASSSNSPIRFYIEMHQANLQYWSKHHGNSGRLGYSITILIHHLIRIAGQSFTYLINPSQRKVALYKLNRSIAIIRWFFNQFTTETGVEINSP